MTVRELLLQRQGLLFLPPAAATGAGSAPQPPRLTQAVELQVAELGFALSHRLAERLATLSLPELTAAQEFLFRTLAAQLGADQKHTPLFRKFPEGVPEDTAELYFKKILLYFCQAEDQPCLFCGRRGTTHVLSPCRHVICDRCFDGASYSACPACEHHVDPRSPFFQANEPASGAQTATRQHVRFKLVELGADLDESARALFVSLAQRVQAMSPSDRDALVTLVSEYRERVLDWIPEKIPVKENRALLFGTLLKLCGSAQILPQARAHLTTATDVLRLIAAYSGADPALQGETILRQIPQEGRAGWLAAFAHRLGLRLRHPRILQRMVAVPLLVKRFKVAKLSRPTRKLLLAILEGLNFANLVEDVLRHRAYWIWVGEFLHPFEHARRFPNTALAFCVLRGTKIGLGDDALGQALRAAPSLRLLEPQVDGSYLYRSYAARLERAATARDSSRFTRILGERPGELARRLDHALQLALKSDQPLEPVVEAFTRRTELLTTPVLLTLRSLLPRRVRSAPVRIYWPKGEVAKGIFAPDARPPIPATATAPIERACTAELLRRFAEKPTFASAILDTALSQVVVPFNERTASRAAVALPRGSSLALPDEAELPGQLLRMFLHWCQPDSKSHEDATTDLDLSVAFFGASWEYVGVCSYYGLRFKDGKNSDIALSSGDLRDAPFPDGATEFVDLHIQRAREAGIRYAVMVVSSYDGLPFSQLERSFAGLMLRDEATGAHFDPRTVELKFELRGVNGIYLPMVIDLQASTLHWLDVYSKGDFALNNVETSKNAMQKICPELIGYFASGVRPSMYELALLHAAARCHTVWLRGPEIRRFSRQKYEEIFAFHQRLLKGDADESMSALPAQSEPVFAALLRGDLELPEHSSCYALFRERQTATIAASDLLS